MAQVVLFRPAEKYSRALGARRIPLGLIHLAAPLLMRGISVRLIDGLSSRDWREELRGELGPETICAGVSVMTGHPIRNSLEFSRAIKEIHPVPVVWGGIHPSLLPFQTLEHELVDMVIAGDGEESFVELVEALRDGRSVETVPGLHYRREGQVRANERRPLELDRQPAPAYHLVDVESYVNQQFHYLANRSRSIELNTDRGCPSRCAFCYNLNYNKRRWRALSAPVVLDRLEDLVGRYHVGGVNFVSDNFFVNRNRVGEICQGILDRSLDINWHSDIRIDNFLRMDDELIGLVRRSGCRCLTFGVESGSDRMLALINKDITVDEVKEAHRRARKHNFLVNYHFMMGLPDETRDDLVQTLNLIAHLAQDPEALIYGPSIYTPFPGTPLFERAVALGLEEPKSLEDWIGHDRSQSTVGPWIARRDVEFFEEAKYLARTAYGTSRRTSAADRLMTSYARIRFAGFQRGFRVGTADIRLARLAKSILRPAA